ncbi:MAG: hypothetical protein COW01_02055 [Bdellovibrionales bacterium CG12_big_fil_rev_8_21_14_0_65_38_15]|nr:MAG: hypothetical protein COW79_02290 [Bdellovibrionales bacterium CG22_combo_CG10-13_8_21_14_all_38_13]PIQ57089.1 MAG: hypothetical protein COW01_02055 [Bdellovibrionales bacterium CG12_big_fil_rev_8_21_14_0_65_38_15]PIR30119.1 MAG: hypothetical protein COV38_07450 [Bdellovibrionales bacterium CG11_big_fil_rev_8_21_14_0_20_38_13]
MIIKNLLTLTLLSLLATSCGGHKARTNFNLTAGATVTGFSLDGGTFIRAINKDSGVPFDIDMTGAETALIPFGNWDLHLIGYGGAGAWQGTTYCGSLTNVSLDQPTANLSLTLDQTNCAIEPYLTMISDKASSLQANWDSAVWDTDTWGP